MKKIFNTKIFILLLTIIVANITAVSSGQSQVYAKNIPTQYIVSLDGLGDFTSIQEAANHAKDGDTLLIYPGIYTENVEIMNKNIHIIGFDRNSCIIQYDTVSYHKVPLTIAAGTVSNLTIYGICNTKQSDIFSLEETLHPTENLPTNNTLAVDKYLPETDTLAVNESLPETNTSAVEEIPSSTDPEVLDAQIRQEILEHQNKYTGYAIHIDDNYLYQKKISFKNCRIISENNHCVGIGSRGNSNITFEDCEIISIGTGGCIYLHDCLLPEYAGNANFEMKNCKLTSYKNPYVLTIESLGPYNPTYVTFENVRVNSVAFDETECYVPNNINTGFDVDTLSHLDETNQLEPAGFTSTAMHNLVHELNLKESHSFLTSIEELLETKNLAAYHDILPEGITSLKTIKALEDSFEITTNNTMKKSVLNFQNANGQVGTGWCGLDNVYLTPNSYGNTLIEMNSTNVNGLSY